MQLDESVGDGSVGDGSAGNGSLTVRCKVTLKPAPRGRKTVAPIEKPEADPKRTAPLRRVPDPRFIPRLTRMLVLAHRLEQLVRDGNLRDYAELARQVGISKGRMT